MKTGMIDREVLARRAANRQRRRKQTGKIIGYICVSVFFSGGLMLGGYWLGWIVAMIYHG